MKDLFICGLTSASFLLTHALSLPSTTIPVEPIQKRAGSGSLNPKYFWEPGTGPIYGHYDLRFYSGIPVSSSTAEESLHHLVASYLKYLNSINIPTWLAHGTLLGWFWNGKILPWDTDLDVQVWADDIYTLAEHNMTLYNYSTVIFPTTKKSLTSKNDDWKIPKPTEPYEWKRRYLLDVNPYHVSRESADWMNVIDARWVDTVTGLFIDVTGLSDSGRNSWTCKNRHRYPKTQLDRDKMVPTVFEGARAMVPMEYRLFLGAEYGHTALVNEKYANYTFFNETAEWIRDGTIDLG